MCSLGHSKSNLIIAESNYIQNLHKNALRVKIHTSEIDKSRRVVVEVICYRPVGREFETR
jgi:hypothetical protein